MADHTEMARLLDDCVVWVCECHARGGSGFLVAPGLVLTCAHVLQDDAGGGKAVVSRVDVEWLGGSYPGSLVRAVPDTHQGGSRWGFPDLALIRVDGLPDGHPYVHLGDDLPPDRSVLYTAAFNKSYTEEPELARAWISYDAPFGRRGQWSLSLADRELEPGMSGGPILDPARGAVCGVLTASRNPGSPEGGFATPVTAVRDHLPEIWDSGQASAAARWQAIAAPAFEAPQLTAARVRRLLELLPGDPAALHRLHRGLFPGRLPPDPPLSDPMGLILEAADALPLPDGSHPIDVLEGLAAEGAFAQDEERRARVEIHLTAAGMDARKLLLSVWSHVDDDPAPTSEFCHESAMDAEEARETLRTVLRRFLTRLSDIEDVLVEFVLPRRMMGDGGDAVDEFYVDKPEIPLGMQFPVVVRTRDRVAGAAAHQLRRWKRSRSSDPVPRWVDCHAPHSFADFYADFQAADAATLVMMGFQPVDGPGGRALEAVCDAGMPAAVWRRRPCPRHIADNGAGLAEPQGRCGADGACSAELFKSRIAERLGRQPLERLPWVVRDLRLEARRPGSDSDHCGRDLTLLWDDPTRPDPDAVALVAPTGGSW
ncbi:trypsin-like peptidase domain-containing protein [Actinomadura fulvescens]|uniref:vWA-MoxR associated protein C-terminal domain-containing protein n=1 Tax=Actinomadura fulvescens TaxID=46160 RepID=A0ABN3QQ25_9ACTN